MVAYLPETGEEEELGQEGGRPVWDVGQLWLEIRRLLAERRGERRAFSNPFDMMRRAPPQDPQETAGEGKRQSAPPRWIAPAQSVPHIEVTRAGDLVGGGRA